MKVPGIWAPACDYVAAMGQASNALFGNNRGPADDDSVRAKKPKRNDKPVMRPIAEAKMRGSHVTPRDTFNTQ